MDRKEIAQLLAGISREIKMGMTDSKAEEYTDGNTFDMTFDRYSWGDKAKIRARIIITKTPIEGECCDVCSNEKVACVCRGEDES